MIDFCDVLAALIVITFAILMYGVGLAALAA